MKKNSVTNKGWSCVKTLDDMKIAIEMGFLLSWRDAKSIIKMISMEERIELSSYFSECFCHGKNDRLYLEITAESYLVFAVNSAQEKEVEAFLEKMLSSSRKYDAMHSFVEICLMSETTDHIHDIQVYALAVAIICDLGIRTWSQIESNKLMQDVSQHTTTYLLSVSNHNNMSIRLSLLNYFGFMALQDDGYKKAFDRMMSRFGHTAFEQLFSMLFTKKSEGVALLYLCKNLPYVFAADSNSQLILHETFRFYLLKNSERFVLFLNYFSGVMKEPGNEGRSSVYLQHLIALYGIVCELGHKNLAREIANILSKFQNLVIAQNLYQEYLNSAKLKPYFEQIFRSIVKDNLNYRDSHMVFHGVKRGRKPSFSQSPAISTFEQVRILGNIDFKKAS